ncbi:hypothetical protein IWZ00DRAFT_138279 [Phyllosticta capitalensis]|uniref:Secreted protein n=1 Tax=Phyllosticta capitalensis TaxID=121624 RepID=A0ABR1Z1K3_9PEZI
MAPSLSLGCARMRPVVTAAADLLGICAVAAPPKICIQGREGASAGASWRMRMVFAGSAWQYSRRTVECGQPHGTVLAMICAGSLAIASREACRHYFDRCHCCCALRGGGLPELMAPVFGVLARRRFSNSYRTANNDRRRLEYGSRSGKRKLSARTGDG